MKHRNRASQVNQIEATNSKGDIERWELFKSDAGIWTLRDAQGIEIEFETTLNESKQSMKRCLQNRGLTAKI